MNLPTTELGTGARSQAGEFRLVAACCRWPLSQAAIREAAAAGIDWAKFLRIVARHRVFGLVHHALQAAGIDVPSPVTQALARRALLIARNNLALATETVRLQRELDAARIPAVVLKGVALAQLAYGTLDLKHARDIDLLVPPECAEAALALLERQDYALALPARHLSAAQRRAAIRFGKDVELVHRDGTTRVELQWRPALNSQLLRGVDARAPTQDVTLLDTGNVRTLADADLFAYLCVHGASHFWSRLKWLADLNAFVARKSEAEIVTLYRHAQAIGAGRCAGQALLLCHRLLGLKLAAGLGAELQANQTLQGLVEAARGAMARPDAAADRGAAGVAREVLAQFSLGRGLPFIAEQCRIAAIGAADATRLPLPPALYFLYPVLRLPLWLWRRASLALRR